MSLITMGSIAVSRDLALPGQPLTQGVAAPRAAPSPPGDGPTTTVGNPASFAQLLVAQIPSEALLGYTTLLALFTATSGGSYTAGRWALYTATIAVCALAVVGSYFAQKDYGFDNSNPAPGTRADSAPQAANAPAQAAAGCRPHLPYLPILTASMSMAVYGLTVPGSPLQFEVSPTAFGICSGCLAVGGGVMMSIFAPFLGKGNAAKAIGQQ